MIEIKKSDFFEVGTAEQALRKGQAGTLGELAPSHTRGYMRRLQEWDLVFHLKDDTR